MPAPALTSLGAWDSISDHLAQAENVRVALEYVARGETPFGIVYATDAQEEKGVRVVATFPDNTPRANCLSGGIDEKRVTGGQGFPDILGGTTGPSRL